MAEYEERVNLAADVIDDADDARGLDGSEPPTKSAWKLDALAVGALIAGAILALALRRLA